jgi:4-carboxymuconolactone decarboxylase
LEWVPPKRYKPRALTADPVKALEPMNKEGIDMSDTQGPPTASQILSEFAPKLTSLTQEVLFGDVWERPELPKRDRSLATVAALVAGGNAEQLVSHLRLAKRNGLTETELKEVIIHLAFYAGWPRAMSAMLVAKRIFDEDAGSPAS